MKDISDINDIRLFVDDFYAKVRRDELIGPIFLQAIPGDWQAHLDKMYVFWNAVLFGVAGFKGNPFSKHAPLNIWQDHFDRWLLLFGETIDKYFKGRVADDAKNRADIMAEMFLARLGTMAGGANKVVV
ncbi:MAG TPA: group III truncated hemoglobin [Mucilaginibacter sp.]|nr:group III truncated hemoglobin [Mucilaginibacter sp.]